MNDKIKEYIEKINPVWQVDICQKLDQIICDTIPEVESRIQYSKPHYLKNGTYAVVFGTAKKWVSLTIFNANSLEVPSDLFERSDNGDRITIKIQEGHTIDEDQIVSLIKQASDTI